MLTIDTVNHGMLEYNNELNSPHSSNTYDEALNRIITGDIEFVEFPLDSLGFYGEELIDLSDQIHRNWHDDNDTYELEDIDGINKEDFTVQVSNFIKMNFININIESSSLLANKAYETVYNILQHSPHINASSKDVDLLSTPFSLFGNSLAWHADFSPIQSQTVELNEVAVLIPLKGPGTKFCDLSHSDREEYNKKQYIIEDSETISDYLDSETGKFLNQVCSDSSNVFQVKPYHGVIFKSDMNFSAIHSVPDFYGERLALRVTFSIES